MGMAVVEEVLGELGLNEKEISIYLSLLSTGTAPASTLGHRTGIKRSTARYTCQQLHRKGLVRMVQKGDTYLFTHEPPEKLKLLLQKKREELQRKENHVDQIIGELKLMVNPQAVLPKVQFYEGEEEMIRLYERILDLEQPIDSFEESGELFDLFPEYPKEFVRKRIKHKIFNRCIAPKGNPLNVTDPKKFIECRFVDPEKFPFSWHVKICANLVGIFSFQKHASVAIAIEHEDIAKNFRLLFELVWGNLKS
jgi:HTH-type transcriptional regulator, sugar sensing transcriptional regulator